MKTFNDKGKLVWNGNELVFELEPNSGVAGIANNMPDEFGEELARRFNQPPQVKEENTYNNEHN